MIYTNRASGGLPYPGETYEISPGVKSLQFPRKRNDTIELFRVLAACGVVWFHSETAPFKWVGFSGLVFFLIIAIVFQAGARPDRTALAHLGKRADRLLLPWAAWFLVYGFLNALRGKGLLPYTNGALAGVLGGPWLGLWYLPFSFISSYIVYALVRFTLRVHLDVKYAFSCLMAALALVAVAKLRSAYAFNPPWAQWVQAVPSVAIGCAMAFAREDSSSGARLLGLQGALLVVCAIVYPLDAGISLSYAIGSTLVTVGLLFERQLDYRVREVSALCFGVYLVHGAVLSGLKFVPAVTAHFGTWYIATLIISFLAAAFLQRMPLVNKIV